MAPQSQAEIPPADAHIHVDASAEHFDNDSHLSAPCGACVFGAVIRSTERKQQMHERMQKGN